jgi:hypothetical protein
VIGEWETDDDGKASLYPLVAFETFVPHGSLCGLKVHYFKTPADLISGEPSCDPLVMTPDLARQLAAALASAADAAEHGPRDEITH